MTPEPDPRALAVAALLLAAGLAVRLHVPRALRARPVYGTLSLVLAGSLVAAPAGGGGNPAGVVTRWYISDPVGSTTLVVGATGEVSRRKLDPFGLVAAHARSEEIHRRYGGQRVEPVSELADFRARWYDPESGRFLSADPLIAAPFDPQQHNAFAYARGNPLRYTDPTGIAVGAEAPLCAVNPAACILAIGLTIFNLFGDVEAEADEGLPVFLGPAGPPGSGLEINVKVDLPEASTQSLDGRPSGDSRVYSEASQLAETAFRWLIFDYEDPLGGSYVLEAATLIPLGRILKGPRLVERGTSVIGHFPEYLKRAEEVGARRFSVPDHVWSRMTDAERWAANKKFLDRAIRRGDTFDLATSLDRVRPGSHLEKEIEYLLRKGYRVSPDGSQLLPPK